MNLRTPYFLTLTLVVFALGAVSRAAVPYNFAVFSETSGSRPFTFTNNGGTSATIGYSTSVPITFNYTTPTGLSTADRPATLTIAPVTPPSTFTPASVNGTTLDQPIGNRELLTITETSTGKNLLTMSFTGDLLGASGGLSSDLLGSDSNSTVPRTVTFTSDYLSFTTPGNSYDLSLAAMNPSLSVGPGGFLNSFAADITGQFTANAAVPEPASLAILGLSSLMLLARPRR